MISKKKELYKNTFIFGIGTFGSKIMQMILVPLYTVYMTTGEFGVADIISSTNSLISPILMLGIGNGILRFLLNQKENEKTITKFAVSVSFGGTLLLFLLSPIYTRIESVGSYGFFIPLIYLFSSLATFLGQVCKAEEKNVLYAVNGIVNTVVLTIFCVITLAYLKLGVWGYLFSITISYLFSTIYYACCINLYKILSHSVYEKRLIKNLLDFSIPLIPNELSWWVIQMSDRYMVLYFYGSSLNGIYSMAYKIPGIFNMLVSIFIQAFGITAIKESDDSEYVDGKINGAFFQELYYRYMEATFVAVIIVILLSRPLAFIFLKNDFYVAWKYIPILLIAFAIGNLQAYYGSILSGIKKTRIISKSTIAGMIFNIILNLIMIPVIGAYGAATATAISYFVIYLVRLKGIRDNVLMDNFERRTMISLILTCAVSALYISGEMPAVIVAVVLSLIIMLIHRDFFTFGFHKLKKILNKVGNNE